MIDRIIKAIQRCKPFGVSIFLTYVLSSSAGIVMAQAGNGLALAWRDKTVHKAFTSDKASIAQPRRPPAWTRRLRPPKEHSSHHHRALEVT